MTTNIMIRALLVITLAANGVSPAFARNFVVPKLSPKISPTAGVSALAVGGSLNRQGPLWSLAAPMLGLSLMTLPQTTRPGVEPAAPAAIAVKAASVHRAHSAVTVAPTAAPRRLW